MFRAKNNLGVQESALNSGISKDMMGLVRGTVTGKEGDTFTVQWFDQGKQFRIGKHHRRVLSAAVKP